MIIKISQLSLEFFHYIKLYIPPSFHPHLPLLISSFKKRKRAQKGGVSQSRSSERSVNTSPSRSKNETQKAKARLLLFPKQDFYIFEGF